MPRKANDKVKTDRRDEMMFAPLLRAGQLTVVWVPDEAHETMRDLVRMRAQRSRKGRRLKVGRETEALGRRHSRAQGRVCHPQHQQQGAGPTLRHLPCLGNWDLRRGRSVRSTPSIRPCRPSHDCLSSGYRHRVAETMSQLRANCCPW